MNTTTLKTMFSSEETSWATPQKFFDRLNERFKFTLDPCASQKSAKCSKYYTKEDDGLAQSWSGHTVFMNPPYGREIAAWVKKAFDESRKENTTVVCLLPSRTDTRWWHSYCMHADEIYFVKGRLKFGDATNAAPFPSAVVVFVNNFRPKIKIMENDID